MILKMEYLRDLESIKRQEEERKKKRKEDLKF